MNNKKLLLIFLGLLGIYLISQYGFKPKTRSFKTELIQIDTTNVNSIFLYPKNDNHEEIILKKEGTDWIASQGNITTKANQGAITSLLKSLSLIQTKRVAAKNAEKWKDYEVEESNGSRIKVYADSELLEDFIVGRFNFNQQTRQGISYVRLTNEKEVYAVDGFLSMTMGQGFDAYRNRQLLAIKPADITHISIDTEGLTETYSKIGNEWSSNGNPIDSAQMATYLNGLQYLSGSEFVDDFDELQANSLRYQTVSLEGNNMSEPVLVTVYRDTSRTPPFIIQSSINSDSYFSSDENGIYEKLFTKLNQND